MPEKLHRNPCRAAMMEFEINMAEMPLGKLSKSNIQKGSYIQKSLIALEIYSCFALNLTYVEDAKKGYPTVC
jgi:hypothetical protein